MKITSLLALGSAAAALLAIPAIAQDAAPGTRPARMMADTTRAQAEQTATTMFARMDANGDGTLDAADRAAQQQARFDRLDTDGNGQLSPAEFTARPERAGRGQPGQRADRRGDRGAGMRMHGMPAEGTTQAQFVATALEMFDRADADSNGTVTREERRAARPQRASRAGGTPPATMQ
ncbi:EF-hand domain-containing protein [Croceibacterium mercuriale]|uniref:EF-hand domain-containing protein n=1 Tax=Croceibacterium mercuriale TaxID=1572751 RepID=UPI00068C1BD3|nr:EF-hand domain-containing protein [Croceibacterium mercuriale]